VGASRFTLDTRIQLCGRFVVRFGGERLEDRFPGRQGRLLFAFLLTRPYRAATRDELIDSLWSKGLPSAPDMALSALLSKLRRLLGEDTIEGRSEVTLRLPIDAWVDIDSAREAIHRAESLVSARQWWEAYGRAVRARYIAERRFLRGEDGPWIDAVRTELEDIHVRALECSVMIGLAVRGHEAPIAARSARRLIELAPYRESGYRLLMEALERDGNTAEAIRVYDRLRTLLRDELGTSPCSEVQRVYDRLLART
jgi:DNA-binding SARP family transcriptional activator